MPLPPGANRWPQHFEDPALEQLSRLAFNGIKDLNAAIKALNPKAVAAQNTATQNAQLIAQLQGQIQNITNQVTNITNITNNNLGPGGNIDCGTFEAF